MHDTDRGLEFKVVCQCPLGLELLLVSFGAIGEIKLFQCPHGLELLRIYNGRTCIRGNVSMPSRA